MVHVDKIIEDAEFEYEGVFNFKELLSVIKDFLGRYDYDIDEKLYNTKIKSDLKDIKIKWTADRKLDDYNKCILKLVFNLNDFKEGYVDGEKVVDGIFKLVINAEVERDYLEKWKKSPTKRFVRAVYERYVSEAKQDKIDKKLKDLVDNLKKELKQYFNS